MYKRKGFTLIELLVVIAIIALLMAILMPALSKVRRDGKRTACGARIKQWVGSFSMWLGDHNRYFMRSKVTDTWNEKWMNMLLPYYKDKGLLFCPAATKLRTDGAKDPYAAWHYPLDALGADSPNAGDYSGSYGNNSNMYDRESPATQWRTDQVKNTATIPLIADMANIGGWPNHNDNILLMTTEDYMPKGGWVAPWMLAFNMNRHGGEINMGFMDMSCRTVGLKELWTFKWHRGFNTRNQQTKAFYKDGKVPPTMWPQWMRRFRDY